MELRRDRLPVERLGQHRPVDRDDRDAQPPGMFLGVQFRGAALGRRQEHSLWRIRRILQPAIVSIDADEHFHFRVERRHVLVSDRPVKAEPVPAARFEIIRPIAQ